ncbi:hypothetical protein ACFFNY_18130 [Paenibacillus hodogayensis]|uniref:Lipoprotein n=1 Tax=Paenibacillus hodogayensis TaxID=279208 RepID=A0ABV5VZJ4_9BACL
MSLLGKGRNRRLLAGVPALLLMLGSGCGNGGESDPAAAEPKSVGPASQLPGISSLALQGNAGADRESAAAPSFQPIVVAEGTVEAAGGGAYETIRVWWTEGQETTDLSPGPYMGTFLDGKFEAVAYGNNGEEKARLELNGAFDGQAMSFRKGEPFKLLFDDYNGDGAPDFAIGQRAGSNGSLYAIITLREEGFRLLEQNVYSVDSRESIRYRKAGNDGFINTYYDQQKGTYMETIRRWKDGAFLAEAPTVAADVHSAGTDD